MTQIINEIKIIKEKKLNSCEINCVELIKYKNKDYIIIGLTDFEEKSSIQIYNSIDLELVGQNDTELGDDEINDIKQMFNQNILVCGHRLRIFTFYLDNNILNIILVQLIEFPKINNKYNIMRGRFFKKAFVLEQNLYREKTDKIAPEGEKIIVNGSIGIFIYKRNDNNEKEDNLTINHLEKSEEINQLNINDFIEKWNNNPYIFKEQISFTINCDVIQINYRYLAVTRGYGYVCLLDIETKGLITIFEAKTTSTADRVIFMLNKDIICVGGDDAISLISIKDFDFVLLSVIKPKFQITEICIMDEFNILIAMRSKSYDSEEYLLHYKLDSYIEKLTKKIIYNITQVSSELTSKNKSNLTMVQINRTKFVTIVENKYIQIREINQSI